jgi:hypothetical protein
LSVEAEVVATAKAKAAAAEAKAVMAAAAEAVMAAKAEAVMAAAAEAAEVARTAATEVRAAAERAIEEQAKKNAAAKAMEAVLGVAVPGDSTLRNYPPSGRDRGHADAPLTDSHASQGKSDSRRQASAAQGEPPRRARHQHARSPDLGRAHRTTHASRHSPEGRVGGRRSAEDDEERRWLAKLEQRERRQHSGKQLGWSSASRLASQTLVALNAIQQHVDSLGLVAVFDSIDANHTGEVSASQLAKALMRMGVHMDGEVEARLLSKQIIRAANQRHGSTLRILAFDIFCHLFGQRGALHRSPSQRGALHIGETFTEALHRSPTAHRVSSAAADSTPAAGDDMGGRTPSSAVSLGSPLQQPSGEARSSPPSAGAELRQHQRYLEYLLRCQQEGIQPAPEVAAMAHEMMENTKEVLALVASVERVEEQLGVVRHSPGAPLSRAQTPPDVVPASSLSPKPPPTCSPPELHATARPRLRARRKSHFVEEQPVPLPVKHAADEDVEEEATLLAIVRQARQGVREIAREPQASRQRPSGILEEFLDA